MTVVLDILYGHYLILGAEGVHQSVCGLEKRTEERQSNNTSRLRFENQMTALCYRS